MTDRTPTTEAGRRLLDDLTRGSSTSQNDDAALDRILAIEDEARAPLVAALERWDGYNGDSIVSELHAALSREARP